MYLQIKMPENRRTNVFRGKQRTNMVPSDKFRGFEDRKIVLLMFCSPDNRIKDKWNVFSG